MSFYTFMTLVIGLLSILVPISIEIHKNKTSKLLNFFITTDIIILLIIIIVFFLNNNELPIKWKDKAFERMIQTALDKNGDYIYPKELDNITSIFIIGDKITFLNKDIDSIKFNTFRDSIELTDGNKQSEVYEKRGNIFILDDISHFPELKELYVFLNEISNIEPLAKHKKLEKINLSLNKIENVETLNNMENLTSISLESNNITDISFLQSQSLTKLKSISFYNNKITNVNALEKAVNRENIEWLQFGYNRIFEVPNLTDYKSLFFLSLHSNYLQDISFLSDLEKIRTLSLSNNKILNINVLENLKSLKNVYLENNVIKDISNISDLNLDNLNLCNNKLTIFPNEFKNRNCNIDIRDNFIEDKSDIKEFKNLKSDFQVFEIFVTQDRIENPTYVNILIDSLHGLESAFYSWNSEKKYSIDINKQPLVLDIPRQIGTHNLYITASDKFGNKTEGSVSSQGTDDKIWSQYSFVINNMQ